MALNPVTPQQIVAHFVIFRKLQPECASSSLSVSSWSRREREICCFCSPMGGMSSQLHHRLPDCGGIILREKGRCKHVAGDYCSSFSLSATALIRRVCVGRVGGMETAAGDGFASH